MHVQVIFYFLNIVVFCIQMKILTIFVLKITRIMHIKNKQAIYTRKAIIWV